MYLQKTQKNLKNIGINFSFISNDNSLSKYSKYSKFQLPRTDVTSLDSEMKITLITSNKNRHNYFINEVSKVCNELFVIQECRELILSNPKSISNTKNYIVILRR